MFDLENKRILVTGATLGIGKAVCQELNAQGAELICIARREEELKKLVISLNKEKHSYYSYDLKVIDGIEQLMKRIVLEHGKLDGVVHSAGVGPTIPLKNTTYDMIHDVMLINFYSFIEMVRVYSNKKNNNGGSIVGISAVGSLKGDKGKTAYCASKAAMDGAIRAMSKELIKKGIRINSVQPGWVNTPMLEEYNNTTIRENSLKKGEFNISDPKEIANIVSFLLCDNSTALSGIGLYANGVGY